MSGKFPEIKTYPYDYRKLRVNAGEVAGNDGIKSSHNSQLAAVFLGKITKGKKFYFHFLTVARKDRRVKQDSKGPCFGKVFVCYLPRLKPSTRADAVMLRGELPLCVR